MRVRLLAAVFFVCFLVTTASAQMSGGTMGGESGFVDIDDGARIYYEVHGEGEPMVLIHGFPLNGGLFRDNVGPLSEQFQLSLWTSAASAKAPLPTMQDPSPPTQPTR